MRRNAFIGAGAATAVLALSGAAAAQILTGVPAANPAAGTPDNVLASGYTSTTVAQGSDALENPVSIYTKYGFLNEGTPNTRTEPDQNTYITTPSDLGGPTDGYDYGHRFLIQGHENGAGKAYFTRINLDVTDPAHRITLLTTAVDQNTNQTGLSSIDGSVYDPFTQTLLFSSEAGNSGRIVQQKLKWGANTTAPALVNLDGSLGRGGYEGETLDRLGNLYVTEDTGGTGVTDGTTVTKVKQPNSFLYRFVPTVPSDLTAGKLQVLQIKNAAGTPITFHGGSATDARNDALGDDILALHSGAQLNASWVTIHDTTADGTASFDANAAAKAKGGTPLKRPENAKFVPGTDFTSLVFNETGDTDQTAGNYPGAAARGSWGAYLRLDLDATGADTGKVKTIVLGDQAHAAFDNLTFLDKDTFLSTEDRGDTLHAQANTLDSIWSFDLKDSQSTILTNAKRLVALGRDSISVAAPAENNEPTGVLVSNGSTAQSDLIGTTDPAAQDGVKIFFTQQHGKNQTFEITPPAATLPTGDKGPAGDKGGPGDKGPSGEQGQAGPVGPAGPAGSAGPKGATGAAGAAGANGTVTVNVVFGKSGTASAVRAAVNALGAAPGSGVLTAILDTKVKGKTVVIAKGEDDTVEAGDATLKLKRSTSKAAKKLRGKRVTAHLRVTFSFNSHGNTRAIDATKTVKVTA